MKLAKLSIKNNHVITKILGFLAITTLCVLIWFGGLVIQIDDVNLFVDTASKLAVIIFIVLLWLVVTLYQHLRFVKAEKQIIASYYKSNMNSDVLEQSKFDDFRNEISQILSELKKQRFLNSKHYKPLNSLPWYLVFGSPGNGKTTAILNSGLEPALLRQFDGKDDNFQQTSNFGCYITEEAVFLEIKRYNKDDNPDSFANNIAWIEILKTLKQHKRGIPINGVIVAVQISILLVEDEIKIIERINTIKKYIKDLYEQLGISFPIYLVFTKCDLIDGFLEYFNYCSVEEKEQAFGITLKVGEFQSGNIRQVISNYYDRLIKQLVDNVLWLLEKEKDLKKRELICFFPIQLLLIKNKIIDGLEMAFKTGKLYQLVDFRGFYFSSTKQDNELSFNYLNTIILKQLKLTPSEVQQPHKNRKQVFFLKNIFRKIVLPEAGLVQYNKPTHKFKTKLHSFLYLLIAVFLGCGIIALAKGYVYNEGHILRMQKYVDQYALNKSKLNVSYVSLVEMLPVLDSLKNAIDVFTYARYKWILSFHFYQTSYIRYITETTLQEKLQTVFMPVLARKIEYLLVANQDKPDYLYEILKAYLVLGNPSALPTQWLSNFMLEQWNNDKKLSESQKKDLNYYLNFALTHHLQPIQLNQELIYKSVTSLQKTPPEQKVYERILAISAQAKLRSIDLNYLLSSGGILTAARTCIIPGIFTKVGFYEFYNKHLLVTANEILNEIAMLTKQVNIAISSDSLVQLIKNVNVLYTKNYLETWKETTSTFKITPIQDLSQAIDTINQLKQQNSVLITYLNILKNNTNLPIKSSYTDIKQEFSSLNNLSQINPANNNGLNVNLILSTLNNLSAYLTKIKQSNDVNQSSFLATKAIMLGQANDPIGNLFATAERLPEPVSGWLKVIAASSWHILLQNTKNYINTNWQTQVMPIYEELSSYYPFNTSANIDANTNDFGELFSPGGILDKFYQNYLRPFINTSQKIWVWHSVYGEPISKDQQKLMVMQDILQVSSRFFFNGSKNLHLDFKIKPISLTPNTASVRLKIGNQSLLYRHDPQNPVFLKWSPAEENRQITITFRNFSNQEFSLKYEDDWSLFKMIQGSSAVFSSNSNGYNIAFKRGAYSATFQIMMANSQPIYLLKAMKSLSLPVVIFEQ